MKKKIFENITLELLIKYFENEADTETQSAVENWLKANPDNPVYFNKIKEAWTDLSVSGEINRTMIESDWQKVLDRIKSTDNYTSIDSNIRWYNKTWIKIAATFLLLFSIGTSVVFFTKHNISKKETANIVYNELVVPKGQKSQLVLSDGSKIWVNAGSKLRFPNRFDGKIREVWLDGEAFFEVAKDKSKPFFVHTSELKIKVLGTVFNVKAYNNDDYIETTLVSGLVSLEKQNHTKKDKEIFLEPNHKAIYLKTESQVAKEEVKKHVTAPLLPKEIIISEPVSTEEVVSWKDGKLVFDDETFESIARKLELRYDVRIEIKDTALKNYRYTGILKNISIEQAIKALQLTAAFKYKVKENTIIVSTK